MNPALRKSRYLHELLGLHHAISASPSFFSFLFSFSAKHFQQATEEELAGRMTESERYFVLSQTNRLWKEHLQALKFLQQVVGLRGYAQRDPLVEYKLEGYNLFLELMAQIRRNVIYSVYQVSLPFMFYKHVHLILYLFLLLLVMKASILVAFSFF
jgi:preprotein translocase subunit SecA